MNLNPKQEEAKNKINGPLLIIAGAGSGKTATLTARVEYMISEKNIIPESILMVTFTNKAAGEMKERVAKVLNTNAPRSLFASRNFPSVGTFHSIGIFMLKTFLSPTHPQIDEEYKNYYGEICEHLNLRKDFLIYDESDKSSVLRSIIKDDLQFDIKEFPPRQIAFYISNAKNALVNATQYEKEVDSQIKEVVWKVYLKYEERLKQNNAMDFDDILTKALSLLKIPKVLEYFQNKWKYLMIDEYQDTNTSQYEIVRLLALKYKNLAVVGDDSQSIYSWRGADMRNIINFRKDYPDALIVKLEQNYRSTKTIINGANAVIKNNTSGIKKELWTDNVEGEKIIYIEAPDDKLEAKIICDIIKEKTSPQPSPLRGEGVYSDNVVLYRTNAQSRKIEEALMIANIPYRVIGGQKFYDRKEIKDLLSYLRSIFNIDDIVSAKRIINTPTRKIGAKSIETLDTYRENFGLNYFQIIENAEEIEELKPAAKKAILAFWQIYKKLVESSNKLVVTDLIKLILKEINYFEYLTEGLSQEEKDAKQDNIDELINVASEYNGMEPRESLSTFLEEVALITDMDKKDERQDYVTLMTIHTSKGLEYNRVFLTGLEESIFPSFRSVSDAQALEEERRLLYVAMTRAKQELFISRASERFNFGDYVRNPVSRFFKEIPKEYLEDYEITFKTPNPFSGAFGGNNNDFGVGFGERNVSIKKPKTINNVSDFARGDKVSHPKFGGGLIIKLDGELAEIAFAGKGIKKMNIKIAPVRKV
ncbi:MAG: 3'-5' exonuclease [Candidatus Gracilibacteria bacterium]|nr:3'-5' exonuclease [Candidatus Gracilibacteria bacterium]